MSEGTRVGVGVVVSEANRLVLTAAVAYGDSMSDVFLTVETEDLRVAYDAARELIRRSAPR